ncbi:MAG: 50S ribosomal protein L24 [Phycisphaerales bacterium]|nr:50S ribosomal protein L24 [Phycisphaerales bacterium]
MPKHVRKGDQVVVTQGSDKGKVGEVLRVIPKADRVLVRGIALRTKHLKPTQQNPRGGVFTKETPIHISNVSPVVDGKPSRVRFETKADGSKVRVAVRGGKELGVVRGPGK